MHPPMGQGQGMERHSRTHTFAWSGCAVERCAPDCGRCSHSVKRLMSTDLCLAAGWLSPMPWPLPARLLPCSSCITHADASCTSHASLGVQGAPLYHRPPSPCKADGSAKRTNARRGAWSQLDPHQLPREPHGPMLREPHGPMPREPHGLMLWEPYESSASAPSAASTCASSVGAVDGEAAPKWK